MIAEVLLAHAVGDYLLQSDWMAQEKVKRTWPALVHALTYTLPFVLITQSPAALGVIAGTHLVIDRYRLARHVVWLKNFVAPVRIRRGPADGPRLVIESYNPPWRDCSVTGYPAARPAWLTVWLMFAADNLMHILINIGAVTWL